VDHGLCISARSRVLGAAASEILETDALRACRMG
jgi:hypothetical protein